MSPASDIIVLVVLQQLPESLLQLQFLADLYPQLAADDAVGRAKEQLLIHHFGNTFLPAWQKFVRCRSSPRTHQRKT